MGLVVSVAKFRGGNALMEAEIFEEILVIPKTVFLGDLLQCQIRGAQILADTLAADGIDVGLQSLGMVAAEDPVQIVRIEAKVRGDIADPDGSVSVAAYPFFHSRAQNIGGSSGAVLNGQLHEQNAHKAVGSFCRVIAGTGAVQQLLTENVDAGGFRLLKKAGDRRDFACEMDPVKGKRLRGDPGPPVGIAGSNIKDITWNQTEFPAGYSHRNLSGNGNDQLMGVDGAAAVDPGIPGDKPAGRNVPNIFIHSRIFTPILQIVWLRSVFDCFIIIVVRKQPDVKGVFMENVHFSATRLQGGFWGHYEALVRNITVPSLYREYVRSGRIASLACSKDLETHIYWDSDVAKWIEAAAYLLHTGADSKLEAAIDDAVAVIAEKQLPNGYYNTYYISNEPENTFTKRQNHELYCAGHLMEAAIAYHSATGKDTFLNVMQRYADHIYQVFLVERSAKFFTPGHPEVEQALLKLAAYTGNTKYRDLAAYFLEERGRHPEDLEGYASFPWQNQSDRPVREIREARGHCVSGLYLYTAMADLARQSDDHQLLEVCRNIFQDITQRKMSITGGVGTGMVGEAFGYAFDLPNRTNYNETCAAIALAMFAGVLQQTEVSSVYADVIERIWFNGMLSGLSLSGNRYFYENALEIDLMDYDHSIYAMENISSYDARHRGRLHKRRLQRAENLGCSCCPPNISRMLASASRYMYSVDGAVIYCHQFASAVTQLTVDGEAATLALETNYPQDGKLKYTYHGKPTTLMVRIPGWCVEYTGETENGYARFPVTDGETVELELPMQLHFVEANPKIREDAGRFCVTRGPIVYCMEGIDNGPDLRDVAIAENGVYQLCREADFPAPVITIPARRRKPFFGLYRVKQETYETFTAKLIPYFCFANRGAQNMLIWTQLY